MAHVPENLKEYICKNCQVTHAGTPIHLSAGSHNFEPPESCGACGETEFIAATDWVHYHE